MAETDPPPPVDVIADAFDLGRVVEPPAYAARGELGVVWHVRTRRGRWALKTSLIPPDDPSSPGADVDFQLGVLAAGVPIPRPVLRPDGAAVTVLPDGSSHRVYAWVDLDEGARIDNDVAGGLLARIHALAWPAQSIDPWFHRPVPPDRWPRLVAAAHAAGARWAPLLDGAVERIVATTERVPGAPPTRLVRCHLDFNPENVLVDRAGKPWVIDWENSGGGDPVQELAQAAFEFGGDDESAVGEFLDGYRSEGGTIGVRDLDVFAMAFAVQANLVDFYARRALDGRPADRERSARRLESMLPDLLTVERAERILEICACAR